MDLGHNLVLVDEAADIRLDPITVGGGSDPLVAGTEVDPLLGGEQVLEVELHHRIGATLTVLHERRHGVHDLPELLVGELAPP